MKNVAKELKSQLKAKLPAYKFSITSDYNSINVTLVSGPEELPERVSVNHHLKHWPNENAEVMKVFSVVESILESLKPREESSYDSDYGSIPNYYKCYGVGSFEKPYKCTEKKATAEEMMEDFNYVGSRHHY